MLALVLFSVIIAPALGGCQADAQTTASNFIKNDDGTAFVTTEWADGDDYTVRVCW